MEIKQKEKPNVVIILTDDQGYGDLGLHGNPHLETPNMDNLSKTAIEFTHFYVSPLCAPTRASLLTGRYHPRTGTLGTEQNLETFNADEFSIAQALKEHGYETGCFGKWHNGAFYPHDPKGKGFDEFIGFYGGFTQNYFDPVLIDQDNQRVETKGFITDVFTDLAIDFIQRHQNSPFFCYISYNACHTPIQCPDDLFNKYKSKGLDDYNAGIYAMLENADRNIGRISNTLDSLCINENTIVIFLSDNGANMLPPFFMRYNSNLRGYKGTIHEGGNRVPMFIKWDGHLAPNRKIDEISAHIDILPTIMDLCSLPRPDGNSLDGLSLKPLLVSQHSAEYLDTDVVAWPKRYLYTHMHIHKLSNVMRKTIPIIIGNIRAFFKNFFAVLRNPKIRTQKSTVTNMFKEKEKNEILVAPGAIRSSRYRLAVFFDKDELYDIIDDPYEEHNIIDKYPEVADRLRKLYEKWFDDVNTDDKRVHKPPIPIGYDESPLVKLMPIHCRFYGNLRFKGYGFYYDWIVNWKKRTDYAEWDVKLVKSGSYELWLKYHCPKRHIGSMIRISVAGKSLEKVLDIPFKSKIIKRPDRIIRYEEHERTWGMFKLGILDVSAEMLGTHILKIECPNIPGRYAMELYELHVEKV